MVVSSHASILQDCLAEFQETIEEQEEDLDTADGTMNEDDTVSTRAIILTICPYDPIDERRRYGINTCYHTNTMPL